MKALALLSPKDNKVPRVVIPLSNCPEGAVHFTHVHCAVVSGGVSIIQTIVKTRRSMRTRSSSAGYCPGREIPPLLKGKSTTGNRSTVFEDLTINCCGGCLTGCCSLLVKSKCGWEFYLRNWVLGLAWEIGV